MKRGALAEPDGTPNSCSVIRSKSRKGSKRSTVLTSSHTARRLDGRLTVHYFFSTLTGRVLAVVKRISASGRVEISSQATARSLAPLDNGGRGRSSVAGGGNLMGERVELGEVRRVEAHVQGAEVLLQPPTALRPRDGHHRNAERGPPSVYPGEGDLRGGNSLALGDGGDGVGDLPVRLGRGTGEPRVAGAEVRRPETRRLDGAGEESATERRERDQPDAELAQRAEHRRLGVARPQRVFALHGGDGVHGIGTAQQRVVHLRQTEVAHLAGPDELGHRAHRLLDLSVLRWPVQVIEVDVLHAEPQQRILTGLLDVAGGAVQAAAVLPFGEIDAELGRQLDLGAAVADGPADEHLVVSGAVDV